MSDGRLGVMKMGPDAVEDSTVQCAHPHACVCMGKKKKTAGSVIGVPWCFDRHVASDKGRVIRWGLPRAFVPAQPGNKGIWVHRRRRIDKRNESR